MFNIKEVEERSIRFKELESWMDSLGPIIQEYKWGDEEPLDGDEVDDLTTIIKAKINLNQGNITEDEYNEILG